MERCSASAGVSNGTIGMSSAVNPSPSILENLIQRLDQKKLPEAKRRALESIKFKLCNSIISPADFKDSHVMDVAAVIIRNEESDIKAMALEILGSIAQHPLAAAAVSACLPAAHIDDLLDHGPLLLQHSLQQLKAALATHGQRMRTHYQRKPSTPLSLCDVAQPLHELHSAGAKSTGSPAVVPEAAMSEDEAQVHTRPPFPCIPTSQPSALFRTSCRGQEWPSSLDCRIPPSGSLCVPAITPSMLFSIPQASQAEMFAGITPCLPLTEAHSSACQQPATDIMSDCRASPAAVHISSHAVEQGREASTVTGSNNAADGPCGMSEQPSSLHLKLRSRAAATLLGACNKPSGKSTRPARLPHRTGGGPPNAPKPMEPAIPLQPSCLAQSSDQGLRTPVLLARAQGEIHHAVHSQALESALVKQMRSGRPERFASEQSLQATSGPHAQVPPCSLSNPPPSTKAVEKTVGRRCLEHNEQPSGCLPAHKNLNNFRMSPSGSPGLTNSQQAEKGPWLLPSIGLSQQDDQHLFELSVRLQHADNEHDLIAVLQQLAMCTVLDFPVEVLLQRSAMLETVLNVMCSSDTPTLCCMWAIRYVHTLLLQTKQALLRAHNTELTPLYKAFEGPDERDADQFDPEEAALLDSYPLPGGAGALPEWHPRAGTTIDTISCSHMLFLRALLMLRSSNETTAAVFSLLEELMPLLALERGMCASQLLCHRIRQYLLSLTQVLEANIESDTNLESQVPCGITASQSNPVPVLGCLSVHILSLITRLILYVPIEHVQVVVPTELGTRLGQLWCNPCMDLIIPGWRASLQPYLTLLAPMSEQASSLAVVALNAMEQADGLLQAAARARSGETPPQEWLQSVPAALLAIAFGSHTDMLQAVVEAVAVTHRSYAACEHQGDGQQVPATVGALLAALQHPIRSICMSSWITVCEHLQGADCGLQTALLELLAHPDALTATWRLIMEDKSSHVKSAAAFVLSRIVADGNAHMKQALLPWVSWLDCYAADAALSQVYVQADALLLPLAENTAVGEAEVMWGWPHLRILLQRLFSRTQSTRRSAAAQLLGLVGGHGVLEDQQVEEDPFLGLLDGSSCTSLIQDLDVLWEVEPPITDVHNMMACACNAGLPPTVRSSALQRLVAVSENSRCIAAMAVPSFLMECLECVEQSVVMASTAEECPGVSSGSASISITQLTASALVLLGNLCCQSKAVLDWALGHMENLMKSVLPLAFHPLTMMRRAVAVFLAPLLFIPMMQLIKADIFVHVGAIQRTATLPVTPLLQQHYYVPFPVKETSLDSAEAAGSTAAEAEKDHGMVAELIGEQGSQKMHLVQLLISLGKLKDRITCNERPHDNSRDVFAVQNFQERECVIKRCLELLEASAEGLPPEATHNLAATLHLNLTRDRAQGLWGALERRRYEGSKQQLLSDLCQLSLTQTHSAIVASAEGAIACMQTVFATPPLLAGLHDWHIWLYLCRHLLHSSAMQTGHLRSLLTNLVPATVNMLARWCPGINDGNKQASSSVDMAIHKVGIPTQQEHKQAQPAITASLDLVAVVLQQVRLRCSLVDCIACAQLLAGTDFVGLLLNSILANSHARWECRHGAAACLHQTVSLYALLRSSEERQDSAQASHAGGPLADVCNAALEALSPSLCLLLQHIVRQIGMPAQNTHSATVVGQQMLSLGLSMLRGICQALPNHQWAGAWSNAVGVFWLTRLLRDRDVHVRCEAAHLLATLVHPAAGQMRSMLMRAWPEGGTVMMRHGLSRLQPPAFAAAALSFTAASMATSSVDVPKANANQASTVMTEPVSDFGCEAVLARDFFWEGLLARMPPCGEAPTLAAGISTLLRIRAACMPDEISDFLALHGLSLDSLLQHLDLRHQLASWAQPEWRSLWSQPLSGSSFANTFMPSCNGLRHMSLRRLQGCHVDGTAEHTEMTLQTDTGGLPIPHDAAAAQESSSCSDRPAVHPHFLDHTGHTRPSGARHARTLHCFYCPFAVPAIHAAGGAAALIHATLRQASLKGDCSTVPEGTLAAMLTAVALLCLATSRCFVGHRSTQSELCAVAAVTAATECCRCATALLRLQPVKAADMKSALASAKTQAGLDVAVSLAYVLHDRCSVHRDLRAEAANLVAALLAHPDSAGPVIRSWVDDSEWLCVWPLTSASAHEGFGTARRCTVPVGRALLEGLLPLGQDDSERPVLASLPLPNPDCSPPQGPTSEKWNTKGLLCVHWMAVQNVLAHSAEAKAHAITQGLHVVWVKQAMAALDTTGRGRELVKRAKVLRSTSSRDDDEWPVALQTWLSLLRHLAYHSASAKSVVAQTQLLPALQQSWNVVSSSGTILHEGLLLISTLVSDSFDGRHLFATTGQSPLLVTMVRAFLRDGTRMSDHPAACQLLCNFASALDGTLTLLKSPFLSEAGSALQVALLHADDTRASRIIHVCATMASHGAGQRHLLRTPGAPAFFEIAAEYGSQPRLKLFWTAMLELLRNLAFLHDNKAFFLADPRILKLLAVEIRNAPDNWNRSALALSTIWALLFRGERVKATLKGIHDFMSAMKSCSDYVDNLARHHQNCTLNKTADACQMRMAKQLEQASRVVLRVLGI